MNQPIQDYGVGTRIKRCKIRAGNNYAPLFLFFLLFIFGCTAPLQKKVNSDSVSSRSELSSQVNPESEFNLDLMLLGNKRYLRKPIVEALSLFKKAQNSKERYSAAKRAYILTIDEGPRFSSLLENSRSDLRIANEYFETIQKDVKNFEKSIPRRELGNALKIDVQLLPADGLSITSIERANCSETEFQNFVKKIGIKDLAQFWPQLINLPNLYLEEIGIRYGRRLLKLAENRAALNINSLRTHYLSYLEDMNLNENLQYKELRSKIVDDETLIMKSKGITKDQTKIFIFEMLNYSPSCLRTMNSNFVTYSRNAITLARGRYFLRQLKSYFEKHRVVPLSLEEFASIEVGDSVNGTYRDEYGGPYLFFQLGNKVVLKSAGPDLQPNTDDDLLIGDFDFSSSK